MNYELKKFLVALVAALIGMLAFRALFFTIFTVEGDGLSPAFVAGDRVMVNRWSYGLRTGGDGSLFPYGRLCRQQPSKGDLVAYEDPRDSTRQSILFGRCQALPGDTVCHDGHTLVIPSLHECADADYYWMSALGDGNPTDSRTLGFISEQRIIGRAFLIVYSHQPDQPFWTGWRHSRLLLLK